MLSQNIKKIIIRIFSFLPDNVLKKFEKIFSISRGKGFNFSINSEFKNVLKIQNQIDIFVDVGSNKGEYANTVLSYFPKAKCHLFEPSNSNFRNLKKKFKHHNIKIIKRALSDTEKNTFLYYDKKGSGQSSLYKRKLDNLKLNKKEKIRTLKMSTYFNKNINSTVDFCKIDVEGNEMKCLLGFESRIKNFKLIQFEFNACNIDSKIFFKDFWNFFQEKNFSLYRMTPSGPLKIRAYNEDDENFAMNNYLAKNENMLN
tara:strand:- start:442 stop:1212 length:771 start_codon:yes stop_codon:yes gene_type:complete